MASELTKLRITQGIVDGLRSNAERKLHWAEIRTRIGTITDGHLFLSGPLPNNLPLYRGRKLDNEAPFDTIDQLTAREPSSVVSYGRCNNPGNSIFYGSNNLETVFSELGIDVGSRVQVIETRLKPGATVKFTTVGEIDQVRRFGKPSQMLGDGYRKAIEDHWSTLSQPARMRLNFADAFLAEHFLRAAKWPFEYKVTSAFSDLVFKEGIEALFYPSVGHRGGWNIAIPKEVYDNNFEVVSSAVYRIFDAPGYGMFGHYVEQRSQTIEGRQIKWIDAGNETSNFENFDAFLQYALCEPAPAFLLLQPLSLTDVTVPDAVKQALSKAAARTNTTEERVLYLSHPPFAVPMHSELSFETLSAKISAKVPDWNAVLITIASSIASLDDLQVVLNEIAVTGENNAAPAFRAYRTGNQMPIVASVMFKSGGHSESG